MTHPYCSTCGSAVPVDAHFCGRCGASTGSGQPAWSGSGQPAWSGAEETYVPGATAGGPSAAVSYPDAHSSAPIPLPPSGPPSRRRVSPTLLLAAGAVILAVIAAAVALLVRPGGGTAHQAAASVSTASVSSSDGLAPSAAGPALGTSTGPASIAVTPRTATRATVPSTPAELRNAYDSGTPVDSAAYAEGSAVAFETPSHNIECVLTTEDPVSLTCSIGVYDFPQPGPDCDNGAILTINGYGNSAFDGCLPTAFAPGSNTLAYGGSVSAGQFGCVSRTVGVTCLDLATNTGFSLSKQQFEPVN